MVNADSFRTAMSKFATGVTVVTTIDDQGQPHAMTANSFASVSLHPPIVLVSVGHDTHTYGFLEQERRFGVSVLRQEQQEIGTYFAKRPEDRKGEVDYSYTLADGGVPVLAGSIAFFACQVIGTHAYGDHTIYLGEVKELGEVADGTPLLFYGSRWYKPAN